VSYGIVTQYGGSIECDSHTEEERPGNSGTTFSIRIPYRSMAEG
jgi:signal transduction histidine kinase